MFLRNTGRESLQLALHLCGWLAKVLLPVTSKSPRKEKHMERSRGTITAHRLFSVRELGLGDPEPYVDRLIKTFLGIGEAVATRWIQMPKAILILQSAPDNPASGAIYVYDRLRQEFFMLSFEGPDDNLTLDEFLELLPEYNLLQFAEEPGLLQLPLQAVGSA